MNKHNYECWIDIVRAYKSGELDIEQFFAELEKYEDNMKQQHIQFEYFRAQLQEYVDSDIEYLSEAACELANAIEQQCWDAVPSPAEIEEEKKKITGECWLIVGKHCHNFEY
jgi:hypothetical protein